mmetsp:Transcript_28746/g.95502  ORF Transcript_28746/g.95502 Transcript_28746/m.95502 type:complete len:237 (-) Transcript_28746:199-909(-)
MSRASSNCALSTDAASLSRLASSPSSEHLDAAPALVSSSSLSACARSYSAERNLASSSLIRSTSSPSSVDSEVCRRKPCRCCQCRGEEKDMECGSGDVGFRSTTQAGTVTRPLLVCSTSLWSRPSSPARSNHGGATTRPTREGADWCRGPSCAPAVHDGIRTRPPLPGWRSVGSWLLVWSSEACHPGACTLPPPTGNLCTSGRSARPCDDEAAASIHAGSCTRPLGLLRRRPPSSS